MTLLAIVVGCPGRDWLDALALVGFVTLVLVVGVVLVVAWEHAGAAYRKRLADGD